MDGALSSGTGRAAPDILCVSKSKLSCYATVILFSFGYNEVRLSESKGLRKTSLAKGGEEGVARGGEVKETTCVNA